MFDRNNLNPRFNVSEGTPTDYGGRTTLLTPADSGFVEIEPRNPNMTRSYPPPREVSPYTAFGRERK